MQGRGTDSLAPPYAALPWNVLAYSRNVLAYRPSTRRRPMARTQMTWEQTYNAELDALIARVEAATGLDRELDAEIAVAFSGDPGAWVVNPSPHSIFAPAPGWYRTSDDASHNAPEVTASLDAALALVKRVLPGWKFSVGSDGQDSQSWARVFPPPREQHLGSGNRHGRTPALALILALLRALQAQASTSNRKDGAAPQTSEPSA